MGIGNRWGIPHLKSRKTPILGVYAFFASLRDQGRIREDICSCPLCNLNGFNDFNGFPPKNMTSTHLWLKCILGQALTISFLSRQFVQTVKKEIIKTQKLYYPKETFRR